MCNSKLIVMLMVAAFSQANALTLGELAAQQDQIDRATLRAKVEEANAKARGSAATFPTESARKGANPENEFQPYGIYGYAGRMCADIGYQGVIYTRCQGSKETIAGWSLLQLTPLKAVFGKGGARSEVFMGVMGVEKEQVSVSDSPRSTLALPTK